MTFHETDFSSTSLGQTWTNVSSAAAHCFVAEGSEILAGTEDGAVESTDGGDSWTIPDSTILVGWPGLMVSSNDGYSWTRPDASSATVLCVVMDSNYSCAGTVRRRSLLPQAAYGVSCGDEEADGN